MWNLLLPGTPPVVPRGAVNKTVDPFDETLPAGAVARLGVLRLREPSVYAMRFESDGAILHVKGDTGVRRWEVATGRLLGVDNWTRFGVMCGRQVRTAIVEGESITVREIESQRVICRCEGHKDAGSLCLSEDGTLLVTTSEDGEVRLWDADTGVEKQRWACKAADYAPRAVVSPGGAAVAAVSGRSGKDNPTVVTCWDAITGQLRFALPDPQPQGWGFDNAVFVSDDVLVTCQSLHTRLHWWDAHTGKLLQTDDLAKEYRGNTFTRIDLVACPDANLLITGGLDGVVRFWDITKRQAIRRFEGCGRVPYVAISPDRKRLATATVWDGAIRLWDVQSGKELNPLPGHVAGVDRVIFSPSGKQLISGGQDHTIRIWDVATRTQRQCLHGHHGDIHSLALDGSTILSGSANTYVRWFPLLVRWLPQRQDEHYHTRFAFASRPRLLAKLHHGVTIENLNTGAKVATFAQDIEHGGEALALALDGSLVAAARSVWDVRAGVRVCELKFKPGPLPWPTHLPADTLHALSFSPCGRFLASGGVDGAVRLWETATGQELFCSPNNGYPIPAAAFSADGRWLAAVTGKQIQFWDVTTGATVHVFPELARKINDVAFSPDGALLASANSDTTILLWDARQVLADYRRETTRLAPDDLSALWDQLQGAQGPELHRALGRLAADAAATRPFLISQLQRHHERDRALLEGVPRWLADLARRDPDTRDQAFRELERLGELARPALCAALDKRPDADTTFRLERLLSLIRNEKLTDARLQLVRAASVLEWIADDEVGLALTSLGTADPPTWVSCEAAAVVQRLLPK